MADNFIINDEAPTLTSFVEDADEIEASAFLNMSDDDGEISSFVELEEDLDIKENVESSFVELDDGLDIKDNTGSSFVEIDGENAGIFDNDEPVFVTASDQRLHDNLKKAQNSKGKNGLAKKAAVDVKKMNKDGKKPKKYTKLQKARRVKKKVNTFNEFKNTDEEVNKFAFKKVQRLL